VNNLDAASLSKLIAAELKLKIGQVSATIALLDEGNTVPFISRYRKEATGELDEEQLRLIEERLAYVRNLFKRRADIMTTIEDQGKLTNELSAALMACTKLQELEDLYLPYKIKKRTRAQVARERGLESLSTLILAQELTSGSLLDIAQSYVNEEQGVATAADALAGAQDIIAETVSERADFRAKLRARLWNNAQMVSKLTASESEEKEFIMYHDYQEPVNRIVSHRILAINRGENKGILKVQIEAPHDHYIQFLTDQIVVQASIGSEVLQAAIADGYKRLLFPALERELRTQLSDMAEKQAIKIFGLNLRQLLLQQPLSGYTVIGLDPGYRTGCKMAVVGPTGQVLETGVIYITHSAAQRQQAVDTVLGAIQRHGANLISIGNGTASYETEEFAAQLIAEHQLTDVSYLITNEAGASVYSASKLAREELPDLDVTLRGAVSIARRIQDPLAELVKIDPQSIGVGQYQHDVNQKELNQTLGTVVESSVNHVGVELNTASPELLSYVAGVSSSIAKNIVAYRNEQGSFHKRRELLKVARLGPAAFTQCAGFLRIQQSEDPFDNTPVHPESYELAKAILTELGLTPAELNRRELLPLIQQKCLEADASAIAVKLDAGEPTVRDILSALAKPGRDPREDLPKPLTRTKLVKLSDILPGSLVTGVVHNVTDFGAFVDIGIKTKGLVHRSELSHKRFRHPIDVVSVGDIITCLVLSIDEDRNRIALSIKQAK
jgi:uncharacterized protein